MFHLTKKRAVVMAVVGSLALGAGAYAYFTSGGSGTGTASVGQSEDFTVGVTLPANSAPLAPGGADQIMDYVVTNPTDGYQRVVSREASVDSSDGNITSGGVAVEDCSASWFEADVISPATSDLPADLAGGATYEGTVEVRMLNVPLPQDDCEGASPDITVTVNAS